MNHPSVRKFKRAKPQWSRYAREKAADRAQGHVPQFDFNLRTSVVIIVAARNAGLWRHGSSQLVESIFARRRRPLDENGATRSQLVIERHPREMTSDHCET